MADEFPCDTPDVRRFIGKVKEIIAGIASVESRLAAIRPHFSRMIADPNWLPALFRRAAAVGGMGQGVPAGNIHRVAATGDEPSISIHLFANDVGCVLRHRFEPETGIVAPFRSGYTNQDCDKEVHQS